MNFLENFLVCIISTRLTSIQRKKYMVLSMMFSYLYYSIHLILKSFEFVLLRLQNGIRLFDHMNLDESVVLQRG